MSMKTLLVSATMLTALAWSSATPAFAQTQNPDRVVYFTFSQPVTVPGTTLPPGKYQFKVLESKSDRGILQINNTDGSKHFATILVMPTTRVDPAPTPELRFLETAANEPPALGSYWYSPSGNGWEFVYPKDQARELAINTKHTVLGASLTGSMTPEAAGSATVASVSSSGEAAYAPAKTPVTVSGNALQGSVDDQSANSVSNSNAAPGFQAQNSRSSNANMSNSSVSSTSRSDNTSTARTKLPVTAGLSPVAALVGTLALVAAIGLRFRRRQTA
jgi:hypothetical protein